MSPLVAGIVGVILGVLVTVLVVVSRSARRDLAAATAPRQPLNRQTRTAIEHLRGAAAVVGAHDEILAESPAAVASGVLRGNRLTNTEVLELVRDARTQNEPGALNLDLPTSVGMAPRRLAVRVTPLGDGLVLLAADDRSEALRVDETRRDFTANITHELKTPIGAISLLAEAISDASDDAEAVRHFADRTALEAARLNELVSQIISLTRLQSTDPLLAAVPLAVDDVVSDVLDQSRAQAENRGIALSHQKSSEAVIRGDRDHIAAALRNLVQNAIAYSDRGARVAVTVRCVEDDSGDWVEIVVSDNGIGIAEADQPRVFERFYRVDFGRSRANGGTGLGLSIVKHVAAAHGGMVTLWSRLGQGSTFTLRLPAYHPDFDAEGTAA